MIQSPISFFKRLTLIPQGVIIVITGFLPIFAIVSMFPALPSIIDHFHENPNAREIVPLMVSVPGLAIAICAPFAGYFVDKFGRLPILIWATFFYGIFGTAPFFLDSLPAIFVTRFFLGVCEAGILTVVNTLIADYWEDEGRRDWLMLQGIMGPALGAVAIWVAGPVTEIRWDGVFAVYGVAFIIFTLMRLYLFEPKKSDEVRLENKDRVVTSGVEKPVSGVSPFPTKLIFLKGATTLFASSLYYVLIISGSLVFREIGVLEPSRISELSAFPALFIIVGTVLFRIFSRYSNAVQLTSVFVAMGCGLLVIGFANTVPILVLGMVIQQTGAGMTVPTVIAWTQFNLPYEHRGRAMGVWAACFFMGQFSSPWLVARIEQIAGSVQGAFAIAGAAGLVAAIIALVCHFTSRVASDVKVA